MGLKGFVEGGVASVVAGCATHPVDLIKVRMQLHGDPIPFSAATALRAAFAFPSPAAASISLPHPGLSQLAPTSSAPKALPPYSPAYSPLFSASPSTPPPPAYGPLRCLQNFLVYLPVGSLPLHLKIAAGLSAGDIGAAVGNPADVAKVRMQADGRLPHCQRRNYTGLCDAIRRMVSQEGAASFWRGSSLMVNRAMIVTASQLGTYDEAKEAIMARGVGDGLGTHVAASLLAGVVAAVASNPVDVVKTRVMNMRVELGAAPMYAGAVDCAVMTVRAEGIMALYKGFVPTVGRQGPFTVVLFVTLEQVRRLLKEFEF